MRKQILQILAILLILFSSPIAYGILYFVSIHKTFALEYFILLAGMILSIITCGILLFLASFLEK